MIDSIGSSRSNITSRSNDENKLALIRDYGRSNVRSLSLSLLHVFNRRLVELVRKDGMRKTVGDKYGD